MRSEGTTLQDGLHNLYVYKVINYSIQIFHFVPFILSRMVLEVDAECSHTCHSQHSGNGGANDPSEGWGRGGIPRRPNSWTTSQGVWTRGQK